MSNERLRVRGVGRDAGNNKFLSVAFNHMERFTDSGDEKHG